MKQYSIAFKPFNITKNNEKVNVDLTPKYYCITRTTINYQTMKNRI